MSRLAALILLGVALEGCLSDCTVQEAKGSLAGFSKAGCSSSGHLDDDGSLELSIDMLDDEPHVMDELSVRIPGPVVIGARGSGLAVGMDAFDITSSYGLGVADYVITGIVPKGSDATVDVDLYVPRITSLFGEGSFRGHASVIVFDL